MAGGGSNRFIELSLDRLGSCGFELLKVGSGVLLVASGIPDSSLDGGKSQCYEIALDKLLFISADLSLVPSVYFRGEAGGNIGKLIEGEAFGGHVVPDVLLRGLDVRPNLLKITRIVADNGDVVDTSPQIAISPSR